MTRATVVVRRADDSRIGDVVALWEQQRGESGTTDTIGRRISPEAIRAALTRPETVAFVAIADEQPVGYVVLSDCTLNPFADAPCIAVDQLYVTREHRGAGVAKALMAAVAAYAERQGVEQLAGNVPSTVKDANRFFARLGFTPLTVRRVTTTTALHRRLAGDREASRFALDQVLARRRVARVRAQGRLATH
ncbi:MAG TPA: GNAT family N-acetyltransferase [Dermatophilaceae bacterium]|nr:GNAT family N-acetyltransferase [Dermatophilaceae bacterium]